MSTPEDYARLRALLDTLQSQLDALQREHLDLRLQFQRTDRARMQETLRRAEDVLAKSPQEPKRTDRLNHAQVILESAETSGTTDKFLRAIAHAILAVAFELRALRRKDQDAS
jgi:hypothetical protein